MVSFGLLGEDVGGIKSFDRLSKFAFCPKAVCFQFFPPVHSELVLFEDSTVARV